MSGPLGGRTRRRASVAGACALAIAGACGRAPVAGAEGAAVSGTPDTAASALPGMRPGAHSKARASRRAGIYPVYEMKGRWMMLDRFPNEGSPVRPGQRFLVVGSRAAGVLSVSRSLSVEGAACSKGRPVKTRAHVLEGRGSERVGAPIIAIRLAKSAQVDPGRARFKALSNEVDEGIYSSLGLAVRQAVVRELASGDFLVALDDAAGQELASNPKPEKIHLRMDFAAHTRTAWGRKTLVLIDGVQVSKTFRRCLRLADGEKLIGGCAEMPHALMAETNLLQFVAYDPSGTGRPFVLARTPKDPLWGHERWGFHLTPKGPNRFLMDALDPKCRERF